MIYRADGEPSCRAEYRPLMAAILSPHPRRWRPGVAAPAAASSCLAQRLWAAWLRRATQAAIFRARWPQASALRRSPPARRYLAPRARAYAPASSMTSRPAPSAQGQLSSRVWSAGRRRLIAALKSTRDVAERGFGQADLVIGRLRCCRAPCRSPARGSHPAASLMHLHVRRAGGSPAQRSLKLWRIDTRLLCRVDGMVEVTGVAVGCRWSAPLQSGMETACTRRR